jgi:hypothetical protein
MVCECNARGFGETSLDETFSLMFFGNFLAAILAGLVAQVVVELLPLTRSAANPMWYYGGCISAFDLSAASLAVSLILMTCLWNENYGSKVGSENNGTLEGGPSGILAPLRRACGRSVFCLGAVVSIFEASMYVFVFNWTRTLEGASAETVPLGLVFSTFMACCMGGSSLFSVLSSKGIPPKMILLGGLIASSSSMLATLSKPLPIWFLYSAFLLFEVCVGLYWPAAGAMKAKVVSEEARSTIYNLNRVPLNVIVVGVLLHGGEPRTAFLGCACLLAFGVLCLLGVNVPPGEVKLPDAKTSLVRQTSWQ